MEKYNREWYGDKAKVIKQSEDWGKVTLYQRQLLDRNVNRLIVTCHTEIGTGNDKLEVIEVIITKI